METKIKVFSLFKTCLFLALSAVTINGFACADAMYLGNQNRVDTVWQPPHCGRDGCFHEGYYIKFLCQPTCRNVVWVDGSYDRGGNYVPAHFKVLRYRVVNPGSEQNYPGYPI